MNKTKDELSCVYYFFSETKKHNKKEKIHKLVTSNFYVRNELTNIQKIINYKSHFYICNNSKNINITELDDNAIQLPKTFVSKDNSILLEFEDRKLTYLKNYLLSLSCFKKYVLQLINIYESLLNSICLLVQHKLVHNNLHFDSIVVDKTECTLLSNFSFSIDLTNKNMCEYIKHFIIAYEPSYVEWPLELHLLAYLLTNKQNSLSNYNIEYVVNDIINNNKILATFGSNIVSLYKEEALKYFKKYVNLSYDDILIDILKYSYTWDNYALSILFLRILIGIHRTIEIKNKFIILFMKLLVGNIHMNPEKRLSITETQHSFNSILDSIQPKDFKEVIILLGKD